MRSKKPELSYRRRKKLEKQGKLRDSFEIWVDRHNHKMELIRTLAGLMSLVISSVVMLKVFGLI